MKTALIKLVGVPCAHGHPITYGALQNPTSKQAMEVALESITGVCVKEVDAEDHLPNMQIRGNHAYFTKVDRAKTIRLVFTHW